MEAVSPQSLIIRNIFDAPRVGMLSFEVASTDAETAYTGIGASKGVAADTSYKFSEWASRTRPRGLGGISVV